MSTIWNAPVSSDENEPRATGGVAEAPGARPGKAGQAAQADLSALDRYLAEVRDDGARGTDRERRR
jgi:hypothetical protein